MVGVLSEGDTTRLSSRARCTPRYLEVVRTDMIIASDDTVAITA